MSLSKRWKWLLILVLIGSAIGLGLFAAPRPNATLTDLSNLEDLRAQFNQDNGKPRLLLLLSPT